MTNYFNSFHANRSFIHNDFDIITIYLLLCYGWKYNVCSSLFTFDETWGVRWIFKSIKGKRCLYENGPKNKDPNNSNSNISWEEQEKKNHWNIYLWLRSIFAYILTPKYRTLLTLSFKWINILYAKCKQRKWIRYHC